MKYLLNTVIIAVASMGLLFGFAQTVPAQVTHCSTTTGCSDFQLECQDTTGGDVICFNARSELAPTPVDEHRCEVALSIMDKNCTKDNPQPCIVAEDRVQDRCYYLPLTMCVANIDDITDLLQNHPDVCLGTCEGVLNGLNNPGTYPQALCNNTD